MRRRNSKKRHNQVIADVNLTNLIDVVFALLIIFMITAPMMTQGIQVDLPQADSEPVESNDMIQVTINENSEIYIDDELVPRAEFRRRFNEVFDGRKEIPVFLNAHKEITYGFVVEVIDDIQKADVEKFGFLTAPLSNTDGS